MNDYERIAEVIRYLDEHQIEQPDLATLAKRANLSPFHFHRLFSAWAGVTPKDFLQCLTLVRVKQSLQLGRTVLDAALQAGLSGPGRLHDLCINLEAASPGEMKAGGAEWKMIAGFAQSPFGTCLIGESPRGLCHLSFVESGQEDRSWAELQADWPRAELHRDDAAALKTSRQIFRRQASEGVRPALRALVRGTPFQLRVWRALIAVPPGQLVTYGDLAAAIDHPAAARAVGSAVGANPLAYLIPCHRVIRQTGIIGDYRWGGIRKRAMVAWENATTTSNGGQAALPLKQPASPHTE